MTSEPTHQPAPFFVFRTPLLPWEAFESWSAPSTGSEQARDEAALQARRKVLQQRLGEWVRKPEVREALFLASPDLMAALPHWLEAPDSEKGARCERGLVRYFSRMCGRSTPFGLFAGCSVGHLGESTRLVTEGRQAYLRHTRLDMDYLCAVSEVLAQDPALRDSIRFRPNSSLYEAAGRLRFAEGRLRGKSRSYHLIAVEPTPYLEETLARAEGGATPSALAQALVEEDITFEEALAYIGELIESQILVPDLSPAVTGPEPIHDLIRQLRELPHGEAAASALESARDALAEIDASDMGAEVARYEAIAEGLGTLPAKVEMNRLFQSDMVKPAPEAILGPEIVKEAQRAVELLHRLVQGRPKSQLDRFRESFMSRYEGREVPLLEALDEESGIGLEGNQGIGSETSPLLEGLAFPRGGEESTTLNRFEGFLLKRLMTFGATGESTLTLEPSELEPYFNKEQTPLPASLSVMGRIAASSTEALQRGEFKLSLSHAGGPSGATLLGRFCHGDPQLTEQVLAYLKEEEARRPDAVHAEIVHLPEGRIGNVILRPQLRGYEIPYLGRSGAPESQQIPVTDLWVSVNGGRIVLRSKRLNKEVVPRLTNAHNFSFRSLGVYRFLCLMQYQNVLSGLSWSWGALEMLPFLPRVEVGRLVLAKARWRVEAEELKRAVEAKGLERWKALQAWRAERKLPRLSLLVDGDNKLVVDLDNPLVMDSILDLVKNRPVFQLEEFYPGPDDLCAEGPEGRFVHELVIPMTAHAPVAASGTEEPRVAASSLPRTFMPGGEWLFAKLYGGQATLDRVLREFVGPMLEALKAAGAIDGWFFIRYGDPDWHVRLRLHGDPARLSSEALPKLHALVDELQTSGLVRQMVLDTYQRELERYGGDAAMALSERIFQEDSEAVMELLARYPGDEGVDARWRFCLKGMDDTLEAMGFDLEGRYRLLMHLRRGFLQEFGGPGYLERQMGDRFRKERSDLTALVEGRGGARWGAGLEVLAARLERLRPLGAELKSLAVDDKVLLEDLAGSYLHMHANRLLRGAHRAQELVLYDFLFRIYESRLARIRKAQPSTVG